MLEADTRFAEVLTEAHQTRAEDGFGRGEVAEEVVRTGRIPEVLKAGREARQGGVEVFADLALQGGIFVDEVAALTAEQLDAEVVIGPGRFQ